MDPTRFDQLTRSLFATGTRRQALTSTLAGLGSLLGIGERSAGHHRHGRNDKNKHKKKDKEPRPLCNGVPCHTGWHCCSDKYCCPTGSGCDDSSDPPSCCSPTRTCGEQCCEEEIPCNTDFNPPECCPFPRICGDKCCPVDSPCDRSTDPPQCCTAEQLPVGTAASTNAAKAMKYVTPALAMTNQSAAKRGSFRAARALPGLAANRATPASILRSAVRLTGRAATSAAVRGRLAIAPRVLRSVVPRKTCAGPRVVLRASSARTGGAVRRRWPAASFAAVATGARAARQIPTAAEHARVACREPSADI
jgi:hypothetical protein